MHLPTGRLQPAPPINQLAASGFTLIELMVTIAVLAIVAVLAAPSFGNLIDRSRLTASANEVVGALQTARMEAVRRNTSVVLCPSTDGATCDGADWQRLIVFSDDNGNEAVDAATDIVVRDVIVATGNIQVTPTSNVATTNRIRFGADGFARVGSAGTQEGGLSVCSEDLPAAENTRDILVEVSRVGVWTRNGTDACSARVD